MTIAVKISQANRAQNQLRRVKKKKFVISTEFSGELLKNHEIVASEFSGIARFLMKQSREIN